MPTQGDGPNPNPSGGQKPEPKPKPERPFAAEWTLEFKYREVVAYRLDLKLAGQLSSAFGKMKSDGNEVEAKFLAGKFGEIGLAKNAEGAICLNRDFAVPVSPVFELAISPEVCGNRSGKLGLGIQDKFGLSEIKGTVATDGAVGLELRVLSTGAKAEAKGSFEDGAALMMQDAFEQLLGGRVLPNLR